VPIERVPQRIVSLTHACIVENCEDAQNPEVRLAVGLETCEVLLRELPRKRTGTHLVRLCRGCSGNSVRACSIKITLVKADAW
jgi:hypothetical protein